MDSSHMDGRAESSFQDAMVWSDNLTSPEIVWMPRKPGRVAFVGIDNTYVVCVMQTVWFRYELRENWHVDVVDCLEKAHVQTVYCCGNYVKLQEAAGNRMKVCLEDPRRHQLRYACRFCKDKGCATQKTFLHARRRWKMVHYDLEH
ncbi:hypothetical protein AVEN_237934-1 [Araneus ventricosus]|uniref:Uncharacterized protein n=1 Tax=Araneus ventricosus TaxID=182803 RepID=A0A4Y2V9U1_ARAVE|nr:hypothetical protein AVEN_237934-1 [Araneus ventricosus]